jgi:hypothetical protein
MCGLKEASVLAYDQLKEHLAPYGYAPVRFTPGLWKHNKRRTTFTLAIDDFGIKYFHKADADHLFSALHNKYAAILDLLPTGTARLAMSTFRCPTTFRKVSPSSSMHPPSLRNMLPISGLNLFMDKKYSVPTPTHPISSTKPTLNVLCVDVDGAVDGWFRIGGKRRCIRIAWMVA